jgi:hypothetical protein
MTDIFRAMCAELLDELQALRLAVAYEVGCPSPEPPVVLRARAALAQQHISQPYKLPEPVAPTDEELLASVRHFYGDQAAADMGAEDDLRTAHAVLAKWGNSTPQPPAELAEMVKRLHEINNPTPQPVAEGPMDEEIIQEAIKSDLVYRSCDSEETVFCSFTECYPLNQYIISLARAVLARWGTPANTINQEDY